MPTNDRTNDHLSRGTDTPNTQTNTQTNTPSVSRRQLLAGIGATSVLAGAGATTSTAQSCGDSEIARAKLALNQPVTGELTLTADDASCVSERDFKAAVSGPDSYRNFVTSGDTASADLGGLVTRHDPSAVGVPSTTVDSCEITTDSIPPRTVYLSAFEPGEPYSIDRRKSDLANDFTMRITSENSIALNVPQDRFLMQDLWNSRVDRYSEYYSSTPITQRPTGIDDTYSPEGFRRGTNRYSHDSFRYNEVFTSTQNTEVTDLTLLEHESLPGLRTEAAYRAHTYNLLRRGLDAEDGKMFNTVMEKMNEFVFNTGLVLIEAGVTGNIDTAGRMKRSAEDLLDSGYEAFQQTLKGWGDILLRAEEDNFFTLNHLETLAEIEFYEHSVFLATLTNPDDLTTAIDLHHDALLMEQGILDELIHFLKFRVGSTRFDHNVKEAEGVRAFLEGCQTSVKRSQELLAAFEADVNPNADPTPAPDETLDRGVEFTSCQRAEVTDTFEEGDPVYASTEYVTGGRTGQTRMEDGITFGDEVDAPFSGTVVVEVGETDEFNVETGDEEITLSIPQYGDGGTIITNLVTNEDDYYSASHTHSNPDVDQCRSNLGNDDSSDNDDGDGDDDTDENSSAPEGVAVEITDTNTPLDAGKEMKITATVTNQQETQVSRDISLVVGHNPDTVETRVFTLSPGEQTEITMGYTTPEVDNDQEFPVRVVTDTGEAERSVRVRGSESGESPGPSLDVVSISPNTPVNAGEYLEVTATLKNNSGGSVTREAALIVGRSPEQVETAAVTLNAGEQTQVSMGYTTPKVDNDQRFPVEVRTDSDSASKTVLVYGV